jgi:hypothetical protein
MHHLEFSTKIILGLAVIALTVAYFSLPWQQLFQSPEQPQSAPESNGSGGQNGAPQTLAEILLENGCTSVGRLPSSAEVEAALTLTMNTELEPYLKEGWRIIQVCRNDSTYAFALFSEQRSRHLRPGDDPERIPANNLLVAFPDVGNGSSMYKAERFNPNSGDYGTCIITSLTARYLNFDCGGGDGPGGWRKYFQLDFNSSGTVLLRDCIYNEGVETCR